MSRPRKEQEVADEVKELLSQSSEEENNENNLKEENEDTKKEEHFDIVNKIADLNKNFNEIDEYFNNLSSFQSQNDEYLSDLLHYVETHEFTQASALKFLSLLKEKRLKRRKLNNDYEIKKAFDSGRNRFTFYEQREMFMNSIYKKERELSHSYNPRQVSFEEIDQLIAVKRGRKTKEDSENLVEV